MWIRTRGEVVNIQCNMFARRAFPLNPVPLTKMEVVLKSSGLDIDGVRGTIKMSLHLDPSLCLYLSCYQWIAFPLNLLLHVIPPVFDFRETLL